MQTDFIPQANLIIFENFNFNLTMKKLNLLSSIYILLAIFTLNSCNVEPLGSGVIGDGTVPPGSGPVTNGNFKVDFDGQTFVGFQNQATILNGAINVISVNDQGNAFSLSIPGFEVGSYPAPNLSLSAYTALGGPMFVSIDPDDDSEFPSTASYVITELDTINKTVSGTFQFKGFQSNTDFEVVATKLFTNGIFTAIPYQGDLPQDNGGGPGVIFENFFAKVNGENFLAVDDFVSYGPTSINNVSFDSFKAINEVGDEITINIKTNTPVGNYNITLGGTDDKVQIKLKKGVNVNKATSGNVKITVKTASTIKATFSGVVNISGVAYTISAGQFKAAF